MKAKTLLGRMMGIIVMSGMMSHWKLILLRLTKRVVPTFLFFIKKLWKVS